VAASENVAAPSLAACLAAARFSRAQISVWMRACCVASKPFMPAVLLGEFFFRFERADLVVSLDRFLR